MSMSRSMVFHTLAAEVTRSLEKGPVERSTSQPSVHVSLSLFTSPAHNKQLWHVLTQKQAVFPNISFGLVPDCAEGALRRDLRRDASHACQGRVEGHLCGQQRANHPHLRLDGRQPHQEVREHALVSSQRVLQGYRGGWIWV